jgi:hypothetical protein
VAQLQQGAGGNKTTSAIVKQEKLLHLLLQPLCFLSQTPEPKLFHKSAAEKQTSIGGENCCSHLTTISILFLLEIN